MYGIDDHLVCYLCSSIGLLKINLTVGFDSGWESRLTVRRIFQWGKQQISYL